MTTLEIKIILMKSSSPCCVDFLGELIGRRLMVKVMDCVCKGENACVCLSNGRDMRDTPSIGGLAINMLSRRFGGEVCG